MIRTHDAGTLRAGQAGETVTLTGWVARRRDLGGVIFVDLRDASGLAQVVFREGAPAELAHSLRAEYCVKVVGTVSRRPEGSDNPNLATGEVEVIADELVVLSESAPLPFPVEGSDEIASNVEERLRWQYRYLDLRRTGPARALRTRAQVTSIMRRVMEAHGFLDIETPNLTRSTPEGARDFLVPVRLQPGSWYALPQSPQLFKQLLMVAGLERYYQIARCFRDEDSRADRTPEFTQLDVEMSFPTEEDIYALSEELLVALWSEVRGVEIPRPFERLTYAECLRRFGSDRPDLRFGLELVDLRALFAQTEVGVFKSVLAAGGHVGGVVMPGGAELTRKQLDGWIDWAKGRGAKGLAYVLVEPDGSLRSPLVKFFSETEIASFAAESGAVPGDLVFLVAAPEREALDLLGALRVAVAKDRGLIPEDQWRFLWVTDFPMFEPAGDNDEGWTAVHHPFTAPADADGATFHEQPSTALARAYDVVLNGSELGGGSIRIHRAEMQQRVFDTIGLSREEARSKFGFLLEAFQFGPPPHGGIAFGLDRLAAVLAGTDSIREVMAFPKASSGGDPLTGAPTPITAEQRKEAGIDFVAPS